MKGTVTVREAARQMGCTLKNVYDILYAGRFEGAIKSGGHWLIPEAAIKARLKKSGQNNA